MGQERLFDDVLKMLNMDEETYMLWSLNYNILQYFKNRIH
jgi:hypothetical protein